MDSNPQQPATVVKDVSKDEEEKQTYENEANGKTATEDQGNKRNIKKNRKPRGGPTDDTEIVIESSEKVEIV